MREKPVLFSSSMVRAILDGRKTQTRRIVKPQPTADSRFTPSTTDGRQSETWMRYFNGDDCAVERCPFGGAGDRLWVREAFRPWFDDDEFDVVQYRADGSVRKPECLTEAQGYHFHDECQRATDESPWRPSIFMPRWASRLTLEVEAVRVERVQEISEDDAWAEGIERDEHGRAINPWGKTQTVQNARQAYRLGWDSLNAKRGFGWAANPYVWVVTFKRVEAQHGR